MIMIQMKQIYQYQYLIKKMRKYGLENLKDPKAFIEYSNNMQDVYKNIEQ